MTDGIQEHENVRASLDLLYEVGREVATALDLQTVLERVLLLSMKNVDAVSGSIIVTDDVGQPVDAAFSIMGQAYDDTALQLRVTYERGMAGWVARTREAVLIPDTSKDQRWLHRPDDEAGRTGPKSAVLAPIQTREGLVGVITLVHPKPGFFRLEHLDLVEAIADNVGSAIRNARLFRNLQTAHRRYRDLFEDSIDPIFISDLHGRIVEINRQAESMLALDRQKILKMDMHDLHSMDPEIIRPVGQSLGDGETVNYESVLVAGDEVRIPVQVYVRKIHTGGVPQLQWLIRDIRERKSLDAMREDLIAMVYHDLRSPLANITSSLEVLAGIFAENPDESIHSLLSIAQRSTDRIQRLTSSLLDIHRIEAGQVIGTRQPVAPFQLIADAVDVIHPNAVSRELDLTWDVAEKLPVVLADPDMIRRVLINLLENAVKFTPTEGKIHVRAQLKDELVEFSVSDTGPGIPVVEQEKIFEKFSRLAPKDGPRGLGLGLAYCKLAVEAHGGEIWVENRPDRGSNFLFTLPIVRSKG